MAETKPCDSITKILMFLVFEKKIKTLIIIKFMWAIDEYAIKLFESDWKQQLNEENKVPKNPTKNNKMEKFLNKLIIRITPYPPIFNKIAAKIIEPIVGASTWAFGNHKCSI